MNTKGQIGLSKTGILFTIIVFYAVVFVLVGYINTYFYSDATIEQDDINTSNFFGFLGNVITGISNLPLWLNTILFGSLIIIIGWIIFSSLPTFNGGA